MDFVTHACMGVGAARLLTCKRLLRPQLAVAALFASLLPDADSLIVLGGMESYGKYHRVVTHSVVGLLGVAVLSAAFAWGLATFCRIRRWGWFVVPNVDCPQYGDMASGNVPRAPFDLLFAAAAAGTALHWFGDAITDYGSLFPGWPWSKAYEVNWRIVASFDWPIFILPFCWCLVVRDYRPGRRQELRLAASYLVLIAAYLVFRCTR